MKDGKSKLCRFGKTIMDSSNISKRDFKTSQNLKEVNCFKICCELHFSVF